MRTSVTDDTLTYDVSITNTGTTSQQVTLSGSLSSWNCDAFTYPAIPDTPVTAAPGTTTTTTIGPIKWGLGTTSYWWPNVPYQSDYQARLHNLKLQLSRGGKAIQSKVVRFGFRQSERKRADTSHVYYYLNGIRVNYRGDNLQGADYDSIDNGGKGDAYDTFPGFMPPSAQNAGWPQAVRNYQRLNYNFVRIHQELAAPYMLDTTDELGLMLMGETAIRGSNNDQDFAAGHDNMVGHAQAMVLRDRNHPSIVRWSQSNEPNDSSTDSTQFETDLFNAMTKLDGTRPISADPFQTGSNYGLPSPGFATAGHYIGGLSTYTENVNANNNNPYGQGEYIWSKDNTRQGLAWFGTSAMAMRRQDASDVRPIRTALGLGECDPGRHGIQDDHRARRASALRRGQSARSLVEPDHQAYPARFQCRARRGPVLLGVEQDVQYQRGLAGLGTGHRERRDPHDEPPHLQRHICGNQPSTSPGRSMRTVRPGRWGLRGL